MGETDVYGEGVVIYYESGEKNVTDSDLRNLVSELYQADAEAISINGQRIVNSTEIVSNDTYIIINGEPIKDNYYVIKVIGNKKLLEANLTGKNGIVEMAPEYGKKVSVE